MKNIYIINSSCTGADYGIGTYIKQISDYLNTSKINLTVIYLYSNEKHFCVKIKRGVRYIDIPKWTLLSKYNPEQAYNRYCRNAAFLLMPYIDNKQENIFHLNFINQYHLAHELKKRFNCKLFLTIHYYEWAFSLEGNQEKLKTILQRRHETTDHSEKKIINSIDMETKLFNICDRIIAVAHHTADTLINIYNIESSKISILHNALFDRYHPLTENAKIQLRKKLHINDDEKIILFVGRLQKIKGTDFLLAFFRALLKKQINARLIIAGWGGEIQAQIQKAHSIWTRVTFTGFIGQNDLDKLYRIADIGIVPSIYEEFGYVAIEMMMHSIPVFVNKTSGLKEIMQNNSFSTFNIQDSDCAQQLASKISRLLNNETKRNIIAQKCRDLYKQKFDYPLWEKKLLKLYLS